MDQNLLRELIRTENDSSDETLENDIFEFVSKRSEKALLNNKEYLDMRIRSVEALKNKNIDEYSEINTALLTITETICYQAAVRDLILMLTKQQL